MITVFPGTESQYGMRCNTIVKRFPDGSAIITAATRQIFRIPGYERRPVNKWDEVSMKSEPEALGAEALLTEWQKYTAYQGSEQEAKDRAANLARAQRRAKTAVRDLALANPFRFFVTLTFDKAKVNRWDDKEVLRVTKNWLDNTVRRHGLAYVLVPERHKDGAIHFHGFFNGALEGVDSGHKTERGQVIYNLPGWPWGFTTAIEVYGEYGAAVGYVCKYITKGTDKVGGRWYYHGGNLRFPDVEYLNTDIAEQSDKSDRFMVNALEGVEMTIVRTEV